MSKGFAFFTGGLIVTLMGVGGIEHALDLTPLFQSVGVSIAGVCLMWVGTSYLKEEDRPVDNPTLW